MDRNERKYVGKLNKDYQKLIKEFVTSNVPDDRWETYSEIINEVSVELGEQVKEEIKYRVTDGENINETLLSILKRLSKSGYFSKLRRELEFYIDQDWLTKYTKK